MSAVRIGSRPFADEKTIIDVPPVLGRGVRRIDSECLNTVDRLKNLLDLRPPTEAKQNLPARKHKWHGRVAFSWLNGAQDVDTRHDGAVVVGCPAHERKDAVCCERDHTMLSIDHALLDGAAETDPVLDALLEPCQLDMRELAHATSLLYVVPPIGRRRGVRMTGARSLGTSARCAFGVAVPHAHVPCSLRPHGNVPHHRLCRGNRLQASRSWPGAISGDGAGMQPG